MSAAPVPGIGRLLADPAAGQPSADYTRTFTPGVLMEGQVLGQQGASTLVRVDGRVLAFTLPGSWAAGTRLSLQYLGSGSDGLRFLLRTAAAADAGPEQVSLSRDGQSLQSFLAKAPAQLQSPAPLLARPQIDPLPIAAALQRGLQQSGLFYESHLLAWTQGQWSQAALLQEPQGQLSSLLRGGALANPESGATAGAASGGPVATESFAEASLPPVTAVLAGRASMAATGMAQSTPNAGQKAADALARAVMPNGSVEQGTPQLASDTYRQMALLAGTPSSAATSQNLVASHLAPLVGQQLQTLAQQQLQWSGALWPGQWLEWKLRRGTDEAPGEDDGGAKQTAAEAIHWDSTLRLQLPHLGAVEARLRLHGQRLWLDLDGDQAATLQAAYGELHQALQALGLEVFRS
ncbi:flagellar hook-length control protein FliK [Acidithiobacillus caldus]|uniref:flagellar hook-length control protein FliK n=1 Tax=Acidithiobacillus caldus TaxID=33059 RepID=UPI001C06AA25|nr:flagellar hook-length control protein FliK [Acidithiobacillus caldus]MBU2802281.1 flagellar hook-length control protein FliK [Acidithiobacillus caldus]